LGRWHLRRGEFATAEQYLRTAIGRLTARNPNPYDGEPHYNLGLALSYQGRISEAYEAFYKSTWNAAWRGPGYHRLAEIDSSRQLWGLALDHIERSLGADEDNLNARNLKAVVLQRLGRRAEADAFVKLTCELDPLDNWSRYLTTGRVPLDGHQRLDLGFDLLRCNLLEDALAVLSVGSAKAKDGSSAILLYALAHTFARRGLKEKSAETYQLAAAADAAYVFPSRLEEIALLEAAIVQNPKDARAPYYLGNLEYDRKRHQDAMRHWERASELDPTFPTVWRNLGFAYYKVCND
jgi:tetratricopeptide (TPR) repeat protein